MIELGLIGDNINRSQSPHLHRTCGRMAGIDVSYELMIPHLMGLRFEDVFAKAQDAGFDAWALFSNPQAGRSALPAELLGETA